MKTQKEIEQLASVRCDTWGEACAFYDGYTQCQKDIVEELKEWIEITLSAESKLGASDNVIEALLNVKYKIESLNKQD
jgi:hypothetical protein